MGIATKNENGAARLRALLADPSLLVVPGCYDALSARVIEAAGFEAAFLGGFSVSAARLGLPDTGLLSYGEILDQARDVCGAVSIPVFGDGDTGYGNEINVQRTVAGYARAGLSCVMIEDQAWPKRCGHTPGKTTVDRREAVSRVRAAIDVREETGLDVLIMARTDAAATEGLDEALARAQAFAESGADITFVEALTSEEDMHRYCRTVPGAKVANMVEGGMTPWLSHEALADIGYSVAVYPVSLVLASLGAMEESLGELRRGVARPQSASFEHIQEVVGFPEYRERERRYGGDDQ